MIDKKARATLFLVLVSGLLGSCAWAPLHDIRPREDYITAGVQVGDKVEIVTRDGNSYKFEVTEISSTVIAGKNHRVAFTNIEKIGKRSWAEPPHPCGGTKPVGCSVPEVVLILSQEYAEQATKFHKPCVTHDFCYRHGFATYGTQREECDDVFYEDMKQECGGTGGLDKLDVSNYGLCQLAARQTFNAVRRYGKEAYQTTTSTYCDYR